MLKGRNRFGALVLVSLGAALWALIPVDGTDALSKEPNAKGSAAMTNHQSTKSTAQEKKPVKESPFACNMLALDAEGRRRHKTVTEQMRAATKEVQALKDGYAFRFPEEGPLWLRLRGREGVKNFIKAEFGIK